MLSISNFLKDCWKNRLDIHQFAKEVRRINPDTNLLEAAFENFDSLPPLIKEYRDHLYAVGFLPVTEKKLEWSFDETPLEIPMNDDSLCTIVSWYVAFNFPAIQNLNLLLNILKPTAEAFCSSVRAGYSSGCKGDLRWRWNCFVRFQLYRLDGIFDNVDKDVSVLIEGMGLARPKADELAFTEVNAVECLRSLDEYLASYAAKGYLKELSSYYSNLLLTSADMVLADACAIVIIRIFLEYDTMPSSNAVICDWLSNFMKLSNPLLLKVESSNRFETCECVKLLCSAPVRLNLLVQMAVENKLEMSVVESFIYNVTSNCCSAGFSLFVTLYKLKQSSSENWFPVIDYLLGILDSKLMCLNECDEIFNLRFKAVRRMLFDFVYISSVAEKVNDFLSRIVFHSVFISNDNVPRMKLMLRYRAVPTLISHLLGVMLKFQIPSNSYNTFTICLCMCMKNSVEILEYICRDIVVECLCENEINLIIEPFSHFLCVLACVALRIGVFCKTEDLSAFFTESRNLIEYVLTRPEISPKSFFAAKFIMEISSTARVSGVEPLKPWLLNVRLAKNICLKYGSEFPIGRVVKNTLFSNEAEKANFLSFMAEHAIS